jgi:hypothetical protein
MQRPRADSVIPGDANHSLVRSSLVHDHIARVPDNGLMTADAGPEPVTTGSRRLVPAEAEAGGYRPKVARARASRPTGMCCSRSTGPGRCRASADRPLPQYRVQWNAAAVSRARSGNKLPQSTRCHQRRVSSVCHLNCRGGLSFQPWRHRPSLSRQSPGQSPAQCRQCLVRLTSAMYHMIGAT